MAAAPCGLKRKANATKFGTFVANEPIENVWLHLYRSSCSLLISFFIVIVDEGILEPSKNFHSFLMGLISRPLQIIPLFFYLLVSNMCYSA